MGFPPELHAPHVHRAAEVIPPLDRSPPPALAGGLAGRTADSFRTILLMPPIPRVSAIQPLAVMAPAPSLMGHGKLQIQSPMMPQDTPIPEENATPRKPTPQIRRRRKKTIAQITEEDPAEENPIFKPAGLPHFRIGHDTEYPFMGLGPPDRFDINCGISDDDWLSLEDQATRCEAARSITEEGLF